MFYTTTIKSVGNTGVIDAQGRRLNFIGNLPVKEGDTVYTDGRFIFGNAPPKGSPAIFDEQGGIPVLGDEYSLSDSDPKDELRGYFTKSGKYKKYGIKGDEWITNDKRNFGHGDAEIDGKKIIDAGFSDEGDLYVATDGQYRENHTTKYNHHIFIGYHNGEQFAADGPHWVNSYIETHIGEEVTLGVEAAPIDASAAIYKNGEPIDEFKLNTFADMVTAKSLEARNKIMSRSANMDADGNLLPEPPDGVNRMQQPPPPEAFIAAVDARILTFKFDQQGEWDAIITASAYGYCFPFLYLQGSVLEPTFTSTTPEFDGYLQDCIEDLETYIFTRKYYPFLNIKKYSPRFTGKISINGYYTTAYANWATKAIAYYIPLVRYTFFEWLPAAFGASMLFHVHNGEIVTVMQSRCGGGNTVHTYGSWDEIRHYDRDDSTFEIGVDLEENDWRFPIGDKIFLGGFGSEFTGFFDDAGNKLADVPPINQRIHFEPEYPFTYSLHYDAVAKELYTDIGAPNINAVHRAVVCLPSPRYSYQENGTTYSTEKFPDEYFSLPALKPYRFLNEFFDEKATTDINRDGLYRFNPSCEKLRGDKFLFGIYGEKLYLGNSDGWQEIGDGLKNFRLRELKNIRKAKK